MRAITARCLLVVFAAVAETAFGEEPKHVLFAFVDHFEPWTSEPGEVELWVEPYMAMARDHLDGDGRHPIHSFFLWFRRTQKNCDANSTLILLNKVAYEGFGEIEYHLHHGLVDERERAEPEAAAEVVALTTWVEDVFTTRGALITAEVVPKFAFGFIHGRWALDNSRLRKSDGMGAHREYCGVNQELKILAKLGGYADFTFPAWGTMDPIVVDSIFYARDDPEPASYKHPDNITFVEAGEPPQVDLLIIEGPRSPFTNTNIDGNSPATLARMNRWVEQNVHVVGQDNWVFVKVYTHGLMGNIFPPSPTWSAFFGPLMDRFYTDIEAVYNDGTKWKLHYVSAREMYNIVKAAEAGMDGDPGRYRNFTVKPAANTVILTQNRYRLTSYSTDYALIEMLDPAEAVVEFSMKEFSLRAILEESAQPIVGWKTSDAVVDSGEFGELHFTDDTPSRYYRVRPCFADECGPKGDWNGDGAINLFDFGYLHECLTASAGGALRDCVVFDFGDDGDVDLIDYAAFQAAFGAADEAR